jgi:EAL domain-containing protein (putative c-di-GMP-specific phosphodiesterase class I)
MADAAIDRADLERNLQLALDRDEMVPWYQPEFDLATGRITNLEVLMRWHRPEIGTQGPDAFLEVAIELGIITPLGLGILRTACLQAVAWSAGALPGAPPLRISFNVAGHDLAQPDFPLRVAEILRDTGLPPAHLDIEIDDHVFRDQTPELDRAVAAIRGQGIGVIVDGVGGGFALWNQMSRLRPDRMKFDRHTAGQVENPDVASAILRSVTTMASALGVPVTAVGLEDAALVEQARVAGCALGQGFHLCPPVPAAGIADLLRTRAATPAP